MLLVVLCIECMLAAGVFVECLLLLARFGIVDAGLVALRQSIESLDAPAFGDPVLLSCGGQLVGLRHDVPCLGDGSIEFVEEGLVIAPLVAAQAIPGGGQEASVILIAILRQEFKTLRSLLLAGNELTKAARSFLELHLGQVED